MHLRKAVALLRAQSCEGCSLGAGVPCHWEMQIGYPCPCGHRGIDAGTVRAAEGTLVVGDLDNLDWSRASIQWGRGFSQICPLPFDDPCRFTALASLSPCHAKLRCRLHEEVHRHDGKNRR